MLLFHPGLTSYFCSIWHSWWPLSPLIPVHKTPFPEYLPPFLLSPALLLILGLFIWLLLDTLPLPFGTFWISNLNGIFRFFPFHWASLSTPKHQVFFYLLGISKFIPNMNFKLCTVHLACASYGLYTLSPSRIELISLFTFSSPSAFPHAQAWPSSSWQLEWRFLKA